MSLINQMLQDIEARKAGVSPLPVFTSAEVHAVIPSRNRYLTSLMLLGLVAVTAYLIKDQIVLGQANETSVITHNVISEAEAAMPLASEQVSTTVFQSAAPTSFQPMLDKTLHLEVFDTINDEAAGLSSSSIATKTDNQVATTKPSVVAIADTDTSSAKVDVQPIRTEPIQNESAIDEKLAAVQQKPIRQAVETKVVVKKQMNAEQKSAHEYQMAVSYLQQGRVAEAIDILKKSVVINPQFDDARQTLVGLLIENKRNDEAILYLKESMAQSLQNTHDAQILARLQFDQGLDDDALATLKKSQAFAVNDAGYHGLMAVILQKQGEHSEAIAQYMLALKNNASNPNWLIGLGVSMQALGQIDEAKQMYQKVQIGELSPQLAAFVSQQLKQIQ